MTIRTLADVEAENDLAKLREALAHWTGPRVRWGVEIDRVRVGELVDALESKIARLESAG